MRLSQRQKENEMHVVTSRSVYQKVQSDTQGVNLPLNRPNFVFPDKLTVLAFLKTGFLRHRAWTAMAGSDVVKSGRPIFDDFFQHLWPYIGNNTANVVFQKVMHLWLIRIDQ
ncbi:hypothetical protein TNCV_825171 [Trichonephila clavipes]|nr:hypothetical protein TNCV_825171 [Trichonephila clavipes]